MPVYQYKAVTKMGKIIADKMNIEGSEEVVRKKLIETGLRPISIKKKVFDLEQTIEKIRPKQKNKKAAIALNDNEIKEENARVHRAKKQERIKLVKGAKNKFDEIANMQIDLSFLDRATYDDIISFTQMFLLLKKANFTNMRAMTTMYNNSDNGAMKRILEDIINGLESGSYIYSTMEYYSKVFPPIYVSIIKVGELSGSLVNSLEQGLKYLEDTKRIKKSVKKALMGPLLQSAALIIGSVIAIIFGVPVMENMYASYGLTDQIPPETMAAADFIDWCMVHWYVILAIVGGLAGLFIAWKKTTGGRYMWDKFKISMPIFGQLILKLQLQKFFVAVQINLKNNTRLQEALTLSKNVLSNTVVLAAVEAAESNLLVGDSWIEPFETMPKFPPMVLEMLRIGMETDMNEMIDSILNFMEEDIQITIEGITKVLPNVSMSIMVVILLGFVIIILKPIMEVYMGGFLFEANGM